MKFRNFLDPKLKVYACQAGGPVVNFMTTDLNPAHETNQQAVLFPNDPPHDQ